MKCLNPQRFRPNTPKALIIRCGNCIACRINYAKTWAGRIAMEHIEHPFAYFVTPTYSDINLVMTKQGYPTLVKKHMQDYLKRLRKRNSFRYYLCGEYSPEPELRPHYHLIIFYKNPTTFTECFNHTTFSWWYQEIKMDVRPLNHSHYTYVTKYLVKRLNGFYREEYVKATGVTPEFSLISRRPYLGHVSTKKLIQLNEAHGIYSHKERFPLHTIYKDKLHDVRPCISMVIDYELQKHIKASQPFELATTIEGKVYHYQKTTTKKEKKMIQEFYERRELFKRSIIKT